MEQATHATAPTAPTHDPENNARTSYRRARALADRLVDQVPTLPTAAEAHRSFALDSYEARLHFGAGFAAGRGVLETATLTDAQPTREEKRDGKGALIGYWIGLRTVVDGVPLSAWALTNPADADKLLPPANDTEKLQAPASAEESAAEATQPLPTISTDPATPVVPAVTPVIPLAAARAASAEAGE